MKTILQNLVVISLALLAGIHQVAAQQSTAFTYQGQLRDGGTNANGTYTMVFNLYDAVTNGNQIGSTLTSSPTLANGLFTVNLDFGAGAFNGAARWLDITIQSGTNAAETLTPRVQVLPTPYAQFAAVAATVTNGAIMNAQLAGNAVADANIVSVSGSKISGAVALASYSSNLVNGIWNVGVTPNNQVPPNVFYIVYNNGSLGLSIGTNGSVLIGQSLQFGLNGAHITSNGNGGLTVNDNTSAFTVDQLVVSGSASAQSFITTSDRNLKEKFTPIDNQDILERLASLPISRWNFKSDEQTRHIGPMAQDFYAAFNVGMDDKHIATVDEGGVALAAIQGLNEKLKEKDARIEALEKRLLSLEQLVKTSARK